MELNENTITCSGSAPNSVKDIFHWFFSDNEQYLTVDGVVHNISLLEENTLVLSNNVIGGEFKVTYTH